MERIYTKVNPPSEYSNVVLTMHDRMKARAERKNTSGSTIYKSTFRRFNPSVTAWKK